MYNVNLEIFQGPLDLLLHLIEKMELDIYNIPIAKLTESYLEYINTSEEFSLEIAEEYIVMAATLLHIKSKNLLPKFEEDVAEEEEDLVQQLLDYKNYKELSTKLEILQKERAQYLEKESIDLDIQDNIGSLRIPSIKLLKAMENVLKTFNNNENDKAFVGYRREISFEDIKQELTERFNKNKKLSFSGLIKNYTKRNEIVLVFVSILTMIRDQELICIDNENEIILEYKLKE
ncbi:Segregation and condensation protein A [Gemella morbillorum]|uniref:segregation and condensation protein A n=1 Tax=Gemella morbillorum TaxID=29391 RepID=UPI000DA3B7E7|nr:segregation/condensation protein A [Gemella morbillorum]UBH79993.1 segregation/condensation protein A [Gemella morbillorum]SQH55374.1 Segregation and condensation protein A [Gemella morbillorum]